MKKFCKIWAWARQESCAAALKHPPEDPAHPCCSAVCVVALLQVIPVINVRIADHSVVDLHQDVLNGLGVQDRPTQVSLK